MDRGLWQPSNFELKALLLPKVKILISNKKQQKLTTLYLLNCPTIILNNFILENDQILNTAEQIGQTMYTCYNIT